MGFPERSEGLVHGDRGQGERCSAPFPCLLLEKGSIQVSCWHKTADATTPCNGGEGETESNNMNTFTAIIKRRGDWWIGWIEEIPGVTVRRLHEMSYLKVSE